VHIRFGQRFDVQCANLTSIHGGSLKWVSSCRYLGIHFVSGRTLKCSFDSAKAKFYRAFNAMYSKVGRAALLRSKGKHLYYCTRLKLARCSPVVVGECQRNFNFLPIKAQLTIRTAKFLQSFTASENTLCLLFKHKASSQLIRIFSEYGKAHSACQLINAIYEQFMQYD